MHMTGSGAFAAPRPAKPAGRKPGRQKPRPVDVHVGARVRLRRTMLGMSQERLGQAIGLTFQQVQKYERGSNRIGASRLYELGRVLDVPVSFFFDDMSETVKSSPNATLEAPRAIETDTLAKRETLELVRAYYRISSPKVRKRVFELTKTLGKDDDPAIYAAAGLPAEASAKAGGVA